LWSAVPFCGAIPVVIAQVSLEVLQQMVINADKRSKGKSHCFPGI
jgi:hypothetical protein